MERKRERNQMNDAECTLDAPVAGKTTIVKKEDSVLSSLARLAARIHVDQFANSVRSGDQYPKYLKGLLERFVADLSVYERIHDLEFVIRDPTDTIERWLQQNAESSVKEEFIHFLDAVSQRHEALAKSVRNYFSWDDRTRSKRIDAMQKDLQFLLTSLHGDNSNRIDVWRRGLVKTLCLPLCDSKRLEEWWNADTRLSLDCMTYAPHDGWLDMKKDPVRFCELTGWPYIPIGKDTQ